MEMLEDIIQQKDKKVETQILLQVVLAVVEEDLLLKALPKGKILELLIKNMEQTVVQDRSGLDSQHYLDQVEDLQVEVVVEQLRLDLMVALAA
jgi:hypothetical protein